MLYKLISNALYSKKIKNMIKRIHVRLVNKKRNFFTKGCMSEIIFENDLATIRKSKVTLKINKPAYIGKCVLELNKALVPVQYYYSLIMIVRCMKLKIVVKILVRINKCLNLVILKLTQDIMMIQTN